MAALRECLVLGYVASEPEAAARFRDDDSTIGWAVAALVAVGVFGMVWGLSNRENTRITSNPPVTIGQGTPATPAPANQ